jgi:hypothetical protein
VIVIVIVVVVVSVDMVCCHEHTCDCGREETVSGALASQSVVSIREIQKQQVLFRIVTCDRSNVTLWVERRGESGRGISYLYTLRNRNSHYFVERCLLPECKRSRELHWRVAALSVESIRIF